MFKGISFLTKFLALENLSSISPFSMVDFNRIRGISLSTLPNLQFPILTGVAAAEPIKYPCCPHIENS